MPSRFRRFCSLIVGILVVFSLVLLAVPQAQGYSEAPLPQPASRLMTPDTEVLILSNGYNAAVKSYFESNMTGLTFSTFDTSSTVPTLDYLQDFDVILLFEDGLFDLSDEVGDVVYEYVMGGGNVVFGTFYWQDRSDGGWSTDGWGDLESIDPFTGPGCDYDEGTLDPSSIVDHPLTEGVTSLWVDNYQGAAQAKSGTEVVAEWDDGDPFIGYVELDDGQRLIAITCCPEQPHVGSFTGDFYTVWENALKWAVAACEKPMAGISASVTMGEAPLTVQFRGSSNQSGVDYSWSFDTGDDSDSRSPSYTFQNEGTFEVYLTVTNDCGESATDSITINVDAQDIPPVLVVQDLNISPTYANYGEPVYITATVFNQGGSWGSQDMHLLINGQFEQSAPVGVAAGTGQAINFTVYKTEAREYQVTIGEATGTFYLMEQAAQQTQSSGLLAGGDLGTGGTIAIICIGVILVAGIILVFLFARRV